MKTLSRSTSLLAIALALPLPALAQDAADVAQQGGDQAAAGGDAEIVVLADRIRGQVETDLPPIVELNEADVAAYGADSLADLVAQLTPQVSSGSGRGGGRPVFLINGKRVSGFREFQRYPPEAIRKVEVLPEEVALQYGYPATQRVINFILKDNFASRELEFEHGGPTAGGRASSEVEASILTISGQQRLLVGAEYGRSSLLTEAERGVIQTPGSIPGLGSDPDPAEFRSLASRGESLELETTFNTSLGESPQAGDLSLNANFQLNSSRSLTGLDSVLLTSGTDSLLRTIDANPLTRDTDTSTLAFGSSFNKPLGDWQLALTLDATRTVSETRIDRRRDATIIQQLVDSGQVAIDGPLPILPDAGRDRSRSNVATSSSKATVRGTPFMLPAGEVSVTFDAGFDWNRISSNDTRGAAGKTVLDRGNLNAGVNVGLPIASSQEGFLAPLGELNLNLSAGIDRLSDFGTLNDWSAGLTWRPSESLSLQASYNQREAAPGLSQLGDPAITSFNVPVFDFTNGETVLATVTSGGNPLLTAETQRDIKLGAYYDLGLFERTNLVVEYFRNRSDNVTEGFPLLTPAIEAAFPGRVTRDGNGRLVAIDRRPVTFAERNNSRIRYGFNIFGRVGKEQPGGGGGMMRMIGGAMGGGGAAPAQGQQGQQAPATGGPGGPGGPGGAGAFDPARFAQLREQFCAADPSAPVDLSVLPEQMAARLRGPDGNPDPERIAQARARICSSDGAPPAMFDPARMAAMRTALCAEVPAGQQPDLSALPEEFLQRLRRPDGTLDPERVAALRERVCAAPPPQQGDAGGERGGEGRRGGEGGGPRAQGGQGGGPGGGPRGGGGGPGMGGGGGGRWSLSLYHSIELENEALIAPGVPVLDLLDGDALGDSGLSRHRVELEGGMFLGGIGFRLSGNYLGETRVDGSGLPGSSDLSFGDIVTFNLRAFVDLEQQRWLTGENPGFFKGARLSLRADNLFDAQRRVTDQTGAVPLSYQPALIDPLGRTIEVEFRKVF